LANALEASKMPVNIIYDPFLEKDTDLGSLPDLSILNPVCPNVAVIIGMDGSNKGKALYDGGNAQCYSALGATLGAVAKASVHECIGWVQKFNVADPLGELQVPMFTNGKLYHEVDSGVINSLDQKRYIFLLKHVGSTGTYFNNSHSCDLITSDYAYIENVRTMNKAMRGIYANLLPALNGPVYVDPTTGKLSIDMIKFFEDLAGQAIEQMERDGEISGFGVFVDPDQNILSTSELEFVIQNVPVGVARQMKIKISYTTKLS
jgi:hypothetical protein